MNKHDRLTPSRPEFLEPTAVAAGALLALVPKRFKFYTQCLEVGVPGVKPPVAEQVTLLREVGFDGAAYSIWLDQTERRDGPDPGTPERSTTSRRSSTRSSKGNL